MILPGATAKGSIVRATWNLVYRHSVPLTWRCTLELCGRGTTTINVKEAENPKHGNLANLVVKHGQVTTDSSTELKISGSKGRAGSTPASGTK